MMCKSRYCFSGSGVWSAIALFSLLSIQACFKEKPLKPPSNQSVGQTALIEMGPGYANQFFYSLETNTVLSQNDRNAYDLMLDCNANSFNVWLNTAKFMSLVRTNETNFSNVEFTDTTGKQWYYETGSYNRDSCAMGTWWDSLNPLPTSLDKVYIVHLGLTSEGESMGYVKLKINDYTAGGYSISFLREGDDSVKNIIVDKDPTRNYVYVSLAESGNVVQNIEPDKAVWDFCFTRYTDIFYDPYYLPYSVTGVLSNPSKVQSYMDSTVNFETLTVADFELSRLSADRDAVGFEWKRYTNNDYITLPYHIHFIKTGEDKFYKLRFVDFKQGTQWGYPLFEFYQL